MSADHHSSTTAHHRRFSIGGEMLTTKEAAARYNVPVQRLRRRLRRGYPIEEAVRPDWMPPGPRPKPRAPNRVVAMIRSEDEREALAMIRAGRSDSEISEWFGWDVERVVALRGRGGAA